MPRDEYLHRLQMNYLDELREEYATLQREAHSNSLGDRPHAMCADKLRRMTELEEKLARHSQPNEKQQAPQNADLKAENDRLIHLLTDIRFALGDDGKRMQDELVEYCKEVVAERDQMRGFINGLVSAAWFAGDEKAVLTVYVTHGAARIVYGTEPLEIKPTPLEAVEAYLNSKAGSGVEE